MDHNKSKLDEVIDNIMNKSNCNLIKSQMYKCLQELENKFLFRKRKFKQCQLFEQEYKHCVVYSNENKLLNRVNYDQEELMIDMYKQNKENKLENKLSAMQYTEGKLTEEELKNRAEGSTTRKKVIEL